MLYIFFFSTPQLRFQPSLTMDPVIHYVFFFLIDGFGNAGTYKTLFITDLLCFNYNRIPLCRILKGGFKTGPS